LNDTDESTFLPYFLTANHCIATQAEASSLTVIFFYQSAACGGAPPDPGILPQTSGSTLLVTELDTDMTLLQLSGALPGGAGLNGWTADAPSPGETLWGVHHPSGCRKRISMGIIDTTPLDCTDRPANDYYYGRWLIGHTEDGSSGSPLYNSEYLVIGQLYGACFTTNTDCGNSGTTWNWLYGRLDRSFPLLSPYIWESGVWVDFNYSGNETGTPTRPFNTLAEGLNAADAGGHVWIKPGSTSVTPTILQSVHLGSVGGSATIGR
jgi:hypothetical protein